MLYRSVLGFLLLLAVVLTVNERLQEERARRNAEAASGSVRAARGEVSPIMAEAERLSRASAPSGSSATSRPSAPFVPHRVRTRREIVLLKQPEAGAPAVEPALVVPPGILAHAIDERDGWYLLDTNLTRGWAPADWVDEP